MTRPSRNRILFLTVLAGVGALTAAFAFWYWASGETSTVLAALVQPTVTPVARETRTAEEKAARKEEKRQALAEIASGAFGTIESVNRDTLMLRDPQGSLVTLALQPKTKVVVVNQPDANSPDLTVGSRALVLGAKSKSANPQVLVARLLVVAPATYDESNVLLARLDSVQGSTLQVSSSSGTRTVTVAASARVVGPQFAAVRPAALRLKTNVLLLGESVGTDKFTAQVVLILPSLRPNAGMTRDERKTAKQQVKQERKAVKQGNKGSSGKQDKNHADKLARGFGQVLSISATALELDAALRGPKTLVLNETTILAVAGSPNATTADIKVGDTALVRGGKYQPAKFLLAAPSTYTLENVTAGKIKSVADDTLTLKNKQGESTVTIADQTQILDRSGNVLSPANLAAKSKLIVIGTRDNTGMMQAQIVLVLGIKQK